MDGSYLFLPIVSSKWEQRQVTTVLYIANLEILKTVSHGYWDEAIMISSPEVKNPVAVRYCFKNFQIGNVKNGGNLPLFPFRTDNW